MYVGDATEVVGEGLNANLSRNRQQVRRTDDNWACPDQNRRRSDAISEKANSMGHMGKCTLMRESKEGNRLAAVRSRWQCQIGNPGPPNRHF